MTSALKQLILALIVLGFALVGYSLWYHSVSAASRNATTLATAIAAASAANQEASQARSAASGLLSSETVVNQYFLTDGGVVPFLENLQSIGTNAGAQLQVLSVSALKGDTGLTVALHITGSFDAVARTVGAIEYAPYDLTEESLALANDGKNAWHADMTIGVGSQGAEATSTAVSVPSVLPNVPPPTANPTVNPKGPPTTAPL